MNAPLAINLEHTFEPAANTEPASTNHALQRLLKNLANAPYDGYLLTRLEVALHQQDKAALGTLVLMFYNGLN